MSGTNNIRWRESDLKELRRLVKNFNAKISRQREKLIDQGKRYQASQLPQKASVRELRKAIETRRDFNRELDHMQNFIDTGLKFKVDQNTKKSLTATVRDFNLKIDRLSSKARTQGEKAALPEKLDVDDLLKNASSKEALTRDIKDFKGFLKRGAEKLEELPDSKFNIKLTRWQKETMEKRLDEINEARAKELEEWKATDVKYGGKSAGYTQGQARMADGDFDEFEPMKMYNFSSTYSDMREKFKVILRESQPGYWNARTELARINYTEKLDSLIGNHPIGKMLLTQIKGMDLSDFKRTLKGEDDLFLLLYELERHPDNYDRVLQEIWSEWNPDTDMYQALDEYVEKQSNKI